MATLSVLTLAELARDERSRLVERRLPANADVDERVRLVVERVRSGGDRAVVDFLREVDGVELTPDRLVVDTDTLDAAERSLQPELRAAMERTIRNLERFHGAQRPHDFSLEVEPGVVVGERFLPVHAAGLYVPFGSAVFPSTALMLTVPARTAGVPRIVLASGVDPATGEIPTVVLAAARRGGATEVWRVSGTVAMAAFAYGTESLSPVDVVAGPGGRYVEAAKRLVRGVVGVDFDAGPSETLVLDLDPSVPPSWIAADILAEGEHGPDSWAVAVVVDRARADVVAAAFDEELARLPAERRHGVERQLAAGRSVIIVAGDSEAAIAFANEAAVEHVVVHASAPQEVAEMIVDAGTVCIGSHTPSPAGSYVAGSNHVLPTGRSARSTGGLSTRHFGRAQSFERITAEGLASLASTIATYAEVEGLPAHERSVSIRFA